MPKVRKISTGKKITRSLAKLTKNPLFILYYVLIIGFIGFHIYYANRIIPGVNVRGMDISGMKTEDAYQELVNSVTYENKAIFKLGEYDSEITAEQIGFHFLPVETTQTAFKVGRSGNVLKDLYNKTSGFFRLGDINIDPVFTYDEDLMQMAISENKKPALKSMVETHFEVQDDELVIIPGIEGETFSESMFVDKIFAALSQTGPVEFKVDVHTTEPEFTISYLDSLKNEMQTYLDADFVFVTDERKWVMADSDLLNILKPVKSDLNDNVRIDIDEIAMTTLIENIALEVDRNPRGQVLEVDGDKAVEFVSSEDGLKLKIKESVVEALHQIRNKNSEIALVVEVTNPPESENQFGIEEILGVGSSRFKGSASSRIHNIGLASSRVDGILVPPSEIFSFNEAVGPINRDTGYTSAWIISKGRTILGDGGGVCQVSTTVFRAALNAGLPIVERNAHSYRVSYYEQESPVGLDATIYRPSVDLRFRNDTGHYILVTSEFNESDYSLVYKIYGTDDGRKVEMTEPVITSRISPPTPTYIDDPSLSKGTTKQVEYPVSGASVSFARKVTRGDEVIADDVFKSYYRAWGAVYNVGTAE